MTFTRSSVTIALLALAAAPAVLGWARYTHAQERVGMGLIATPAAEYDEYPTWSPPPLGSSALTASAGAAEGATALKGDGVDLRPYLPPPGSQGAQNSCAAWTTAYGLMSYFEAVRRGRPPKTVDRQFSPAFLYNQVCGGVDRGSRFPDILATMRAMGGVRLSDMPYSDRDIQRQPSPDLFEEGHGYRIGGYARVVSREDMKNALRVRLPVIVGIETSRKFLAKPTRWEMYRHDDWKAGTGERRPEQPHLLHAMLVVGFDDGREAFLVMNSWGTDWGQGGYCWMHYDLFDRIRPGPDAFAREAWVAFPRHGMADHAQRALGKQMGGAQGGLSMTNSYGPAENGSPQERSWEVVLMDDERSLEEVDSVTWSWSENFLPRTFVARDLGDGFKVEGSHMGPGYLEVVGQVRFRDRTQATVRDSFLFIDELDVLEIDVRSWYWGREMRGGAEQPTWLYSASIEGPSAQFDNIQKVVWHLDESYGGKTVPSTDRGDSFSIDLRGGRSPTLLTAVVELPGGVRRRLQTALVPFDDIQDDLKIRVSSGSGRGDDGTQEYQLGLWLEGPYKVLVDVDQVTYHLPRRYAERPIVQKRFGGGSFLTDLPPLTSPPGRFDLSAELEMADGTTRRVSGTFVPVE